jgi:hypothetical protein
MTPAAAHSGDCGRRPMMAFSDVLCPIGGEVIREPQRGYAGPGQSFFPISSASGGS